MEGNKCSGNSVGKEAGGAGLRSRWVVRVCSLRSNPSKDLKEVKMLAMQSARGRGFQVEESASVKVLKGKHPLSIQESTRSPSWLE